MTTVLFYDSETTGFPLYKEPSNHPDQPYITQLAAELCDEESGETIATLDHLIRPAGWTIPDDVAALTGITTARAAAEGVAADDVIHAFIELWLSTARRCAHNESFDARIVRIALMRHSVLSTKMEGKLPFADYWKAGPAYCTQGNSTKIVNAARPAGEK